MPDEVGSGFPLSGNSTQRTPVSSGQRPVSPILQPRSPACPLIGRVTELAQLEAVLCNRKPLLILGHAGIGKSALVETAAAAIPGPAAPVRITCPAHPHELLASLAGALLQAGHRTLGAGLRCSPESINRQTSMRLRGVLWSALAAEPRSLILEDVHGSSEPVYRFLRPLYYTPGMSIVVTSTALERLGFLSRLFWDPRERLDLKRLRDHDAQRLARLAADRFPLPPEIDRGDLERRVLECAAGNPGRIIAMYRMAGDSRYHSGAYVKFGLMQIDLAARFAL